MSIFFFSKAMILIKLYAYMKACKKYAGKVATSDINKCPTPESEFRFLDVNTGTFCVYSSEEMWCVRKEEGGCTMNMRAQHKDTTQTN